MPFYDYLCDDCGPFTLMRPMADCEQPSECPDCGASSSRAYLRAPNFSCMSSERRTGHAANERSANAPSTSAQFKAKHGKGCGCCTPSRNLKRTKDGAKCFPAKRPWMISH